MLQWMTDGGQGEAGRAIWQKARKVSADEISAYANLRRLFAQREVFRKENWSLLAKNQERSVFYQVDLQEAAEAFAKGGIALPEELPEGTSLLKRISDAMFRAKVRELEGNPEAKELEARAFGLDASGTDQHDGLPSAAEVVGVCGPDCVGTQPGAYRHCRGMDGYPTLQPDGGRKCGEPGH